MSIQVAPGDVLLLAHGDEAGPVSKLIRKVTGSEYSHTVLALGDGRYVHSSPDPKGPDIAYLDEDVLFANLIGDRTFLLLRQATTPDVKRLRAAAERYVDRATATDPILFSDGALAGIAVVTLVFGDLIHALEGDPRVHDHDNVTRLRAALFHALEDGDRRLFCSEFAFRALDEAGARPALPVSPVVDMSGFPLDEPERPILGWLEGVRLWLKQRLEDLIVLVLGKLELDLDSIATFDEVWERVRTAYEQRLVPTRLTVANFYTPEDFRRSQSFTAIATAREGTGWVPVPLANDPG